MSGTKKNRQRHTTGFAATKKVPHENHPAFYVKVPKTGKSKCPIKYVTFTHSSEVQLPENEKVPTIPLPDNINPAERGKTDKEGNTLVSHVYPRVYEGERGALGSEKKEFNLTKASRKVVEQVFQESPTVQVKYTGNSKKKKT